MRIDFMPPAGYNSLEKVGFWHDTRKENTI